MTTKILIQLGVLLLISCSPMETEIPTRPGCYNAKFDGAYKGTDKKPYVLRYQNCNSFHIDPIGLFNNFTSSRDGHFESNVGYSPHLIIDITTTTLTVTGDQMFVGTKQAPTP